MQIKIINYNSEYKNIVLELLSHIWKNSSVTEIEAKFNWRYENNPYERNPIILLAFDDKKLVGIRSAVVQKFICNNKYINVFSLSDTIIHPDYRRKGILYSLNKEFLEFTNNFEDSFILNLSSSKNSAKACLKQKWEEVNNSRINGYKISLLNLMFLKFKTRNKLDFRIYFKKGEIIINQDVNAKDLADFNQKYRDNNVLTNINDFDFFKWRYNYDNDLYQYAYYYTNDNLRAYIILKRVSKYQFILVDYLSENEKDLKKLISKSINKLRIGILRVPIYGLKEKMIMKKCNFILENNLLLNLVGKKRLPPLVRPTVLNATTKDFFINFKVDIRDINNWHIVYSDIH